MKITWLDRTPCIELPKYTLITCQKDFDRCLRELGGTQVVDYLSGAAGRTHFFTERDSKDSLCIVCIPLETIRDSPLETVVGILAHEGMHVWQEYMSDLRENAPSLEFGAYSIQRIMIQLTAEALRIRNKAKSKRKKK